jgi:Galactose oxidase, central domain
MTKFGKNMTAWEVWPDYPISVGEGQGLILKKSIFVITSGFSEAFSLEPTKKGWKFDLRNTSGAWEPIDDVPLPYGLTHAAYSRHGEDSVYMCGGYVGKHPGGPTASCLSFNVSKPLGSQWSVLPDLPAKRSGGALMYDEKTKTLTFATGASRPNPKNPIFTADHDDVWKLDMKSAKSIKNGWYNTSKIPYFANHIGSTSIWYKGKQRHFVLGGQHGEDEKDTNMPYMYEWDTLNDKWIKRADMLIPRGHFSSSSAPWKQCGFFIAGGRTNPDKLSDVHYYDIATDHWHDIGDLKVALNTPVCDVSGDALYCNTGPVGGNFAWKVGIL